MTETELKKRTPELTNSKTLKKVSGYCGNLSYTLENSWMLSKAPLHSVPYGKVSRHSRKFLVTLESLRIIWKVSECSGKFPNTLKSIVKAAGNYWAQFVENHAGVGEG